ncbi:MULTISPECIES: DUF6296 family protein [unclassified Streptomyces]|uniref:DUF6296 family protein n=1 Tax=unclassified Streptomyces TaxID=2593676 RepID=UPI0021CA1C09|nr:DUF6296 family protein [Streptomyces sp. FIT100]UUN25072.1 hypothetical protein KK483_00510 [Streptomyces sp. FIT100]
MGQGDTDAAYELIFGRAGDTNGAAADDSGEDVVVVRRTERKGPGGHPVYADDTGIVQAEISDRGEVRMLASGGHQQPAAGVEARPVA